MITDCVPFAIFLSISISALIVLVFGVVFDWFGDESAAIPVAIGVTFVLVFITAAICASIPVYEQQGEFEAKIVHTKSETVALNGDKSILATFPLQKGDTNTTAKIKIFVKLNFGNKELSRYYVYAP